MKTTHLAAVLFGLTVASACQSKSVQSPVAPAASAFNDFVDDFFAKAFEFSPTWGVGQGFHEYDNRFEERSAAAYAARIATLDQLRSQVVAFAATSLTAEQKIDAVVIQNSIDADLLQLRTLESWRHNPMEYVGLPGGAIDALVKRDFAPAKQRLSSVIARLKAAPALLQAMQANVVNPPKEFTDIAIQMASGSVGFFKNEVATWAKTAAAGDAALLAQFDQANAAVVTAMEQANTWLSKTLLPASNGSFALGAERYAKQLALEEMVDIPLPKLLSIGEAALARDSKAFIEAAKKINATKTPAEVMTMLSDEHPSAETLLPSARSTLSEAREFLIQHRIVTIPTELELRVEETPAYSRNGTFASMDTPGAYEKKATAAFYYVTPPESSWPAAQREEHLRLYNAPVMKIITVHEAYPGHYLQFIYANQFPTKTRKLLGAASNAEGWAHYAEQMMVEEGFGKGDPKLQLAQLSEALLRDCRFVVGIKLHTEGWTVDKGADLFRTACFQEKANAFQEARRGAYNPTYLYYTLGKLQFYKLRADVKQAQGAAFTLQNFHDSIVKQGALPIALLRTILLPGDTASSL